MAKYHGELMHQTGNVYQSDDDRNYLVAIILAFFLGAMGVHRFFLNDQKTAYLYFIPFAICCFAGFAMLDFTWMRWYLMIASPFLIGEICYFGYAWSKR